MNLNPERPDMLMARIQHVQAANGFKQMSRYSIHPKQVPILLAVMDNEGISQRELAQKLRVKPPTVAVSVKRLSAAGFIIKEDDGKDARVSRLYLTGKAKEAMENIKNTINDGAEKMLLGFSEAEKAQLSGFLKRILNNLGPLEMPVCDICEDETGKENT